jgi:hypothetical protein
LISAAIARNETAKPDDHERIREVKAIQMLRRDRQHLQRRLRRRDRLVKPLRRQPLPDQQQNRTDRQKRR